MTGCKFCKRPVSCAFCGESLSWDEVNRGYVDAQGRDICNRGGVQAGNNGSTPEPWPHLHAALHDDFDGGVARDRSMFAKCGTDSGYYSHRRFGEQPCSDCLAAHAAYHRNYQMRRRDVA